MENVRPRRPTRRRQGITLLEVLISIFVLAVGLLGLASLIPLSRHHMVEAAKLDRGSALAHAALDDLHVRGILDPGRWLQMGPGPTSNWVLTTTASGTQSFIQLPGPPARQMLPPFAIDPLYLRHPSGNSSPSIPYSNFGLPGPPPFIDRLSVDLQTTFFASASPTPATASDYLVLERVFRSQDDQVFSRPENDEERSHQWTPGPDNGWGVAGTDDDGNGTIDEESERGFAASDDTIIPASTGDYSWLVTVAPTIGELATDAGTMRQYLVSLVVFYQRDLAVSPSPPATASFQSPESPTERMVLVDFLSSGIGGGDARLRTNSPGTLPEAENWLGVKPNQWIMLSAWLPDFNPNSPYAILNANLRPVIAWYRVAAVSDRVEFDSGGGWYFREVTLAGPDWAAGPPNQFNDADMYAYPAAFPPSINHPTVYATIIDGAIAVHEQTITLEGISAW